MEERGGEVMPEYSITRKTKKERTMKKEGKTLEKIDYEEEE